MNVNWPIPKSLDDLDAIEDFLIALDIDTRNLTFSEYPCILIEDGEEPRYVGKMWHIEKPDGTPIAFARRAFGQHIVTCAGSEVAQLISRQIMWLKEHVRSLEIHGDFRPTYVMYPQLQFGGLALSGDRYKHVAFVANGSGAQHSLETFTEFMAKSRSQLDERIELITAARSGRRDNFRGLPA